MSANDDSMVLDHKSGFASWINSLRKILKNMLSGAPEKYSTGAKGFSGVIKTSRNMKEIHLG